MWEYFVTHYVKLQYGIAFPLTEIAYVIGVLLILAPKTKNRRDVIGRAVDFVVVWLILTMGAGLIEKYFDWTVKISVLIPSIIFLYAVFRSKLPWDLRTVYGLLYYAIFVSSISISSWLGTISGAEIEIKNFITTAAQIVMLVGVPAYIRLLRLEKFGSAPKYCSALIILVSCIHVFEHEYCPIGVENVRVWLDIGFVIIELVSFHLYYSISKMYDEKTKLNILYLKQERENYVMEIAHSEIEKIKELRHDMKNHLTFMSYLVNEGKTEELKEYLEKYSTELYDALQFSLCGNYVIDYILNFEIKRANALGVTIDYKIFVPPQLPFDDKDLCSLLTNILDNAIEAASKMENKTVELNLKYKDNNFLIQCVNATDKFAEGKISSHLPTTKLNHEVHGYGMKIIRSVVKKYNGTLKITVQDQKFHLSLYLGKEEAENERFEREGVYERKNTNRHL